MTVDFALPTAQISRSPVLPTNVVTIQPGVGMPQPGAEICAASTTSGEICTPKTTPKTGKKRSADNVVGLSISSPGITAPSVVSCSLANAALSKAEFMALVHRLSAMELIERFALDYSRFKDMNGRRRKGCVIAPEFQVFRSFLRHIKYARPSPEWTLDRIDPFRMEYGPGLCRLPSKETQANNRRDTILLTGTDGRTLPPTEWAKITGQDAKTMRKRRERGGWFDADEIAGQRNIKAGVAPPAVPFDASEWPAGITMVAWEAACVTYRPKFLPPRTYLTRAVFFAWVGQNKIDELQTASTASFEAASARLVVARSRATSCKVGG